jgi:hypothetical protein
MPVKQPITREAMEKLECILSTVFSFCISETLPHLEQRVESFSNSSPHYEHFNPILTSNLYLLVLSKIYLWFIIKNYFKREFRDILWNN